MLSLSRTSLAARTAALALVGATLVGCASHPNTPAATVTPETLVSERAQQRWDRLLANDYRQAYDFLTPAYRGLKTPEEYAKTFGIDFQLNYDINNTITMDKILFFAIKPSLISLLYAFIHEENEKRQRNIEKKEL